jgi:hypothetical protein
MNAIEQFFLNHPDLMRYNLPNPQLAIYVGAAIVGLFLCFKHDFEDKEKRYSPVPSWAGKCWRYSWLFGSVALAAGAYGHWRNPAGHKSDSVMEIICLSMWVILFVAGNFGILRAAFRHAREKKLGQSANSSHS